MTIQDLLNMPKGISIEEWEKRIKKRDSLRKRIRSLCNKRSDIMDALDVLQDEMGSERWNAKMDLLSEVNNKIRVLENELENCTRV
jgi:hypothetical protein